MQQEKSYFWDDPKKMLQLYSFLQQLSTDFWILNKTVGEARKRKAIDALKEVTLDDFLLGCRAILALIEEDAPEEEKSKHD